MKLAVTLILCAGISLAFAGKGTPTSPRQKGGVQVAGKSYLPATDWASANNLEFKWTRREQAFQLTNREAKIQFTVDSRDAQFNGVQVVLLFPVILRNGAPFFSKIDTDSTLRPLLAPPKTRSSIKTICLDPGHGGREPGYTFGSILEKKYTLLLAQELQQQLTRAGYKVIMTRNSDTYVNLPERPEIASNRKADLFVSLHFNSVPSSQTTVHGAQVYCLTPPGAPSSNAHGETSAEGWCPGNRYNDSSVVLAYNTQKSLARNLGVEDRGVRRARFWVLREALMPSILVEAGFLSHPTEGRKIIDPAYRREIARAIVEGIASYKKVVGSGG